MSGEIVKIMPREDRAKLIYVETFKRTGDEGLAASCWARAMRTHAKRGKRGVDVSDELFNEGLAARNKHMERTRRSAELKLVDGLEESIKTIRSFVLDHEAGGEALKASIWLYERMCGKQPDSSLNINIQQNQVSGVSKEELLKKMRTYVQLHDRLNGSEGGAPQ